MAVYTYAGKTGIESKWHCKVFLIFFLALMTNRFGDVEARLNNVE